MFGLYYQLGKAFSALMNGGVAPASVVGNRGVLQRGRTGVCGGGFLT